MSLNKIQLNAFRGATQNVEIPFDPAKKITMIFGENGTGKSTIIDGLTFLCCQSKGSLDDRAGTKLENVISVGKKQKDVCVTLQTDASNWTAKLSGKNAISVTPENGCPTLRVLRRAQIKELVEAKPSERFNSIRNFVEIPGVERSEQALRDALKRTQDDLAVLTRTYTNAQNTLASLWEKNKGDSESVETWAERISKQNVDDLKKENDAIQKYERLKESLRTATASLKLTVDTEVALQKAYADAKEKQDKEEANALAHATELLDVLQTAKKFISVSPSLKKCPVCEKPLIDEDLGTSLDTRISQLKSLSEAVAAAQKAKKALDDATTREQTQLKGICDALDLFLAHILSPDIPLQFALKISDAFVKTIKDEDAEPPTRLKAAQDVCTIAAAHWAAMELHLTDNQKITGLKDAVDIQLKSLEDNKTKQEETDNLHKHLSKVLEVIVRERKAFVSAVLGEISQEVSRLYEKIHPGESISSIKLLLDDKFKGSLLITGDFEGEKEVLPQAYFSESHLDTLGICIWLALTKKFSASNALVVLDDVLTSVDSSHLSRFILMLDEEMSCFGHVILTTHYRPWRDRYLSHRAPGNKIHFIELKEWNAQWGIIPDSNKPSLSELKNWLEPRKFDRQIVASKAGILLECILDTLALLYGLSMPRKATRDYTLGDLLSAFSVKKRKLLRVEHMDVAGNPLPAIELGLIMDKFDGFAWVRNQVGCHFSPLGQEISNDDVRAFAKQVIEFGETVICADGGDIPRHTKSGSYYESKSGRCRLYPLEMP